MKKSWEKPKLVILSRGKPEESVLGLCKITLNQSGGGPDPEYAYCNRRSDCIADCEVSTET
jgi:hypothetical protein